MRHSARWELLLFVAIAGIDSVADAEILIRYSDDSVNDALVTASSEEVYYGSGSGAFMIRDSECQPVKDAPPTVRLALAHGQVYLGSLSQGLFLVSGTIASPLYTEELGTHQITVIEEGDPSEKEIWIGTRSGGLFRIASGKIAPVVFQTPELKHIQALQRDDNGLLWIGADSMLYLRDAEGVVTFMGSLEVGDITTAGDSHWATAKRITPYDAKDSGGYRLKDSRLTEVFSTDSQIILNYVIEIDKSAFFATSNGIFGYVGGMNKRLGGDFGDVAAIGFTPNRPESASSPHSIGHLWIASGQRVYQGNLVRPNTLSSDSPDARISGVYEYQESFRIPHVSVLKSPLDIKGILIQEESTWLWGTSGIYLVSDSIDVIVIRTDSPAFGLPFLAHGSVTLEASYTGRLSSRTCETEAYEFKILAHTEPGLFEDKLSRLDFPPKGGPLEIKLPGVRHQLQYIAQDQYGNLSRKYLSCFIISIPRKIAYLAPTVIALTVAIIVTLAWALRHAASSRFAQGILGFEVPTPWSWSFKPRRVYIFQSSTRYLLWKYLRRMEEYHPYKAENASLGLEVLRQLTKFNHLALCSDTRDAAINTVELERIENAIISGLLSSVAPRPDSAVSGAIPVMLNLRTFSGNHEDLEDYIFESIRTLSGQIPKKILRSALKSSRFLFVIKYTTADEDTDLQALQEFLKQTYSEDDFSVILPDKPSWWQAPKFRDAKLIRVQQTRFKLQMSNDHAASRPGGDPPGCDGPTSAERSPAKPPKS